MTKSPKGVLPTKREIVAELRMLIDWSHVEYQDDGPINTAAVLHTIRCLEMALQIVKEWKAPRK